jgi:hypothetical protein
MKTTDRWDTARFYKVKGNTLPSVTTILSVINKPALGPWYAKQEREYFKAALKQLLKRRLSITPEAVEKMALEAKAGERAKNAAAQTGKDLHASIEGYLKGQLVPKRVNAEIRPAFECWLKWWKKSGLQVLDVEKTVYDLENEFAGTMDVRASVNGKPVILDWKSSNGIYPEYHLQNVAYRHAAKLLKMPSVAGYIVRIPKTGEGEVEVAKCPKEIGIEDFLAVLRTWKVMRVLQGRSLEGRKDQTQQVNPGTSAARKADQRGRKAA